MNTPEQIASPAQDAISIQQEKTSEEVEHDLDESVTKQIDQKGDTHGMWVASCTCKKYTCRPQKTPEDARRHVYRHIRKIWRQIERSR